MNNVLPFQINKRDVADMTADEILEHLKGKFKAELIVIALIPAEKEWHADTIDFSGNTTYERSYWMLAQAQKLLLK